MKKFLSKYFSSKITLIIFIALLLVQIFTRFSYPDTKSDFSWDQIDNAWAAKNIIYDHKFPLVGMQAKGNTGFYIGPYYYYLLVPFYLATDLDPIASIYIAGLTSILSFILVYFLIRDMFNEKVALLALFFEVFSFYIIGLDRTQWPVNFIAPISLLIFYCLYKIINGNSKYIILLVGVFGFSLHIHFTSVFYMPLILLCLPFFPRSKETLKNFLFSIPVFVFFIAPIAINFLGKSSQNAAAYLGSSFIGVHFRRFLQISHDAFIEFEGIYTVSFLKTIGYIVFPLYIFILFLNSFKSKKVILVYLSVIWVLLPWIFLATYGGEFSNYYFSLTRPVVLIAVSYLLYHLLIFRKPLGSILLGGVIIWYIYTNTSFFFNFHARGVGYYRAKVDEKIKRGEVIEFGQGNPESYFYFINKERYDKKK